MDLAAIHHTALSVHDLDASARWYADVLGFVELFREESGERRGCVMGFAAGGYSVGLLEHRGVPDGGFDPRRRGLDHLAFTVATREDLERWAGRLTDAGIAHSGLIEIPPGVILNFKDPDGIALALFWDRS